MDSILFGEILNSNTLQIPPASAVPPFAQPLPFVFVGDEAFSLKENFMKPFSHKKLTEDHEVFNYSLSRARRVVEITFGMMCSKFHIFRAPIKIKLERIDAVVKACCVLHNFLQRTTRNCNNDTSDFVMNETEYEDSCLASLERRYNRKSCEEAKQVREHFMEYFTG